MQIIKYCFWLVSFTVLAFVIHLIVLFFLDKGIWDYSIDKAYLLNLLAALVIVIAMLKAPARYNNSLGYMFMLGSMLKFALFFIFFYPSYKLDGEISKQEFSTFFIPYAVCLILETKVLVHKLSK